MGLSYNAGGGLTGNVYVLGDDGVTVVEMIFKNGLLTTVNYY